MFAGLGGTVHMPNGMALPCTAMHCLRPTQVVLYDLDSHGAWQLRLEDLEEALQQWTDHNTGHSQSLEF